jgi:hypothetical protein
MSEDHDVSHALARQPGCRGRRTTVRASIGWSVIEISSWRCRRWWSRSSAGASGHVMIDCEPSAMDGPQTDLASVLPAAFEPSAPHEAASAAPRAPTPAGRAANERRLGARFHARHPLQRPCLSNPECDRRSQLWRVGHRCGSEHPGDAGHELPRPDDRLARPAERDSLRQRPRADQPAFHQLVQGTGHRTALHPAGQARPERLCFTLHILRTNRHERWEAAPF